MDYRLESRFGTWGTPARQDGLRPAAQDFLAALLGRPEPRPRVALAQVELPPSRLSAAALAALGDALGHAWIDTGREARLSCALGSSLADYVAAREGRLPEAPDAVARPSNQAEVERLLAVCAELGLAVVPFGGGTSVVGGVSPRHGDKAGVVTVLLDRMAELVALDEVSLTATVQPGITGPVLERLLGAAGLMWGHLPQSWERATVGGYIATRSAGQASTGYGRSDAGVQSVVMVTPSGTFRLGRGPSSAAGPDLRQLVIGSEGVFGIITQVTLRVRRQPRYRRYEAVMFPDFAQGTAAFRALAQADLTATVMRLSDEAETEVSLALSGPLGRPKRALQQYLRMRGVSGGGCLAILGWEGVSAKAAAGRRAAAWYGLKSHGAVALGTAAGESWAKHRFEGPYLRDTLLDSGYIVETLETATDWARLAELHGAVTAALSSALACGDRRSLVFCHVSHVYGTGASLYFTAVAPAAPDRAEQWRAAKVAASEVIVAHGATITHHHAVGTDHRPWLAPEVGELGVAALGALKATLDPHGIMNPGKLIP